MAKEFSAADIFNRRVEDEYQAEPEEVIEDNGVAEQIEQTEENEDMPNLFEDDGDEDVQDKRTIDFDAILAEVKKIKLTKIKLPKLKIKKIKLPKLKLPEIRLPKFTLPEIKEDVVKKEEKSKKKLIFTVSMVLLAVLVFSLFTVFMFKQYAFVFPSHDDYGYATLSYVYWEEGMWGQNFTMDQLVHYLTQHYNRWGGRILSFGQSILLLREGLDVAQGFHAIALVLTFLCAFLFAQNGKKTKLLPVAAIFTCSMFGLMGKDISISGFYWYCAAILYTVPVLYVFIGAWLMYIMLLDKRERTLSVSKLMLLPFTTVLFFYAGWSMEQVGIFAVVTASAMVVYTCFKRRNPLVLLYGIPPLVSSVAGCHILINSIGNNSRQNSHADYYNLPFSEQILTSADTIATTLFRQGNILTVIIIALVAVFVSYFILRKRKNTFTYGLFSLNCVGAAYSLAVSVNNIKGVSLWLWLYLITMAVTVSIWLFSSKRKQDYLIWALFFGSLASQVACLIAPIFPDRCLMMFVLTLVIVASRAFNEGVEILSELDKKKAITCILTVTLVFSVMGSLGAMQVYNGFKENDRVQQYNNKMLEVTGKLYDEYGEPCDSIPLMKLKDDAYAGSTQPYGRDLIKDWMKIYYKLPDNLQYEDFVYEEYDETRLAELEELLKETENKYLELKNNA